MRKSEACQSRPAFKFSYGRFSIENKRRAETKYNDIKKKYMLRNLSAQKTIAEFVQMVRNVYSSISIEI